jgi:hypothetical protein
MNEFISFFNDSGNLTAAGNLVAHQKIRSKGYYGSKMLFLKNVTFTGWALPYPNNPSQFDYYRSGGSQKKKNRYSYYDCVTYHHLDYFYVTDNITQSTPNGIPIFNNLAQMYKKV